ncbi:MAG TPA: DEAD/DEAH box helicase family protein, partial [Fervidobacterium sp.]|nr:DEAD/DEAH box helicase family protein [Fervidobacterium sp.]
MADLYLQNIVNDICLEDLPEQWQGFDFSRFSKDKTLFDFQQKALENALRGLWLFYKDKNADKQSMFNRYRLNGLEEDLDYDLKKKQDSKTVKYLLEYDKDYPAVDSKIPFSYFINRMSFWMATGSGKTLVIVKLIELLGTLMSRGEIPNNDILFLTYRDDLLDQFKSHVDEFNSYDFDIKIKLRDLKEYADVKHNNTLPQSKNEITVFCYRSDLISDEQKAKIVNFRNYDNDGKWYVLLDEAHKGDKEDSKRQMLYSILSRNGFLFNFSATFTDPRDFATCVFNFNLAKFIEEGYGKHIYVSSGDIEAFRERDDFSSIEKQKIVLKTLLLLTYIDKHFEKIRDIDSTLYHRPLLLTLVNSVSVEDSDLELFFRELEKIANGAVNTDLLQIAKEELIQEFSSNATFTFENIKCTVDAALISQLDYKDILRYVFNAETPGKIEVLKIPSNSKELVFRLMTADKPFALIKIGDISGWLKNKLEGYEINESFENESYFKRINDDDSDINILMGSRSFYEGWDSNRPNVILFINIGIGNDAKKFVLQSVGRGVRIEPLKHQRKRMGDLVNANVKQSIEQLLDTIKDWILPIESLYVFGTNANNLKEIIATLKAEKQEQNLGNVFILNPEAEKHLLLIPVYKTTENIVAETQKYTISKDNLDLVAQFFELIGDKIALVKYNCEPRVLEKAKETFNQREQYYSLDTSHTPLNPELILGRIFNYLHVQSKEVDGFKTLENEIVHFKRIKFIDGEKYDEIRKKVDTVSKYPKEKEDADKLYGIVPKEDYDRKQAALISTEEFEINNQRITIEYLANHYYLPVIIPDQEKTNYLTHIINVESEIEFMEGLKNYLKTSDNVFSKFDWWMFSKLDETLDEVYIPYYNSKTNGISKFKPDFIFWMQKDNRYLILFIDPKGTEHTDAYRKIDGYSKIFET